MTRWCNAIHQPDFETHFPNSPTSVSKEPAASEEPDSPYSPEELETLQNYNSYKNDLAIRLEGGWLPSDTFQYDEDLLRRTLKLSPVQPLTTRVQTPVPTLSPRRIWLFKP